MFLNLITDSGLLVSDCERKNVFWIKRGHLLILETIQTVYYKVRDSVGKGVLLQQHFLNIIFQWNKTKFKFFIKNWATLLIAGSSGKKQTLNVKGGRGYFKICVKDPMQSKFWKRAEPGVWKDVLAV